MTPYCDTIQTTYPLPGDALTALVGELISSPPNSALTSLWKSDKRARRAKYTVLLVNDMPDQLEMMEHLLHESGYATLTAVDGREGYEITKAERPDLVIR